MKKIKIYFALAFATIILLTACNDNHNIQPDNSSSDVTAEGEIFNPYDNSNGNNGESDVGGSVTAERLIMFMDAIKNREIDIVANMCGVYNDETSARTSQFAFLAEMEVRDYSIRFLDSDGNNYTYAVTINIASSQNSIFNDGVSVWRVVLPVNDEVCAVSQFVTSDRKMAAFSRYSSSYEMQVFAYNWMSIYYDKPFISANEVAQLAADARFFHFLSHGVKKNKDNQFTETSLGEYALSAFNKDIINDKNSAYSNFIVERLASYDSHVGRIFNGCTHLSTAICVNLREETTDATTGITTLTYDVYSDFAYINLCRTVNFNFISNSDESFAFVGTDGEYVSEYQQAIKIDTVKTQ